MFLNYFVCSHRRTVNVTHIICNREHAEAILSNIIFKIRSHPSIFTKIRAQTNKETDEPKVVKLSENVKNDIYYNLLTLKNIL